MNREIQEQENSKHIYTLTSYINVNFKISSVVLLSCFIIYPGPYERNQIHCCFLFFRYLSTAVVINKNSRRNVMLDLVKVIQEESYTYKDPITSFIEDLYVNFNFDGAQQKLRQCEEVLESDFFLVSCLNDFIENSRLMIFETFCRIHQCISISMLAEKLNMNPNEAEKWIGNTDDLLESKKLSINFKNDVKFETCKRVLL